MARTAARVLFGALFLFASLAYFFGPTPEDGPTGAAAVFTNGLKAARYFMPLLKGTELVCALLLLANRFVPLALVVLSPIVINIVAVHAFLMPEGLVVALLVAVFHLGLAWTYRAAYAPLLTARAK